MRNLKRVLRRALASVMLLGMMVVGASAADVTSSDLKDMNEVTNKEAVALMVDLGIIVGKPDGTFAPTEGVDRATMAKLICYVLMGDTDPALFEGTKTDLTDIDSSWAKGYIKYCYANNIISGDGIGHFFPTNGVSVVEAAKMLLVALGYDAAAQGYTGNSWSINIMRDAKTAGLLENLSAKTNDKLTRDDAALMIFNALLAKTVKYDTQYDQGVAHKTDLRTTDTILGDLQYSLVKHTGVVVANEYAYIRMSSNTTDAGKTAVIVSDKDGKYASMTAAPTVINSSSTLEQLGQEVVYYTFNTGDKVSSAVVNSGKTKTYTKSDSAGATSDSKFLTNNGLTVPGTAVFAVNYASLTNTQPVLQGYTLIDADANGTVDFGLKTTYTFSEVTKKTSSNITISGTGTKKAADVVGFDNVAEKDYVNYTTVGNRVFVSKAESITGTVTAFNGTKKTAVVDGTTYDVTGKGNASSSTNVKDALTYLSGLTTLKDATEQTYYLDHDGALAIAVGETSASTQYAYLTTATVSKDAWGNSTAEVGAVLADGTAEIYTLADDNGKSDSSSLLENLKGGYNDLNGVYGYYLNADGDMVVKAAVTSKVTTTVSAAFTSGKPTVGTGVLANDSTVALFYKDGKAYSYTGVKSIPSFTGTATYVNAKNSAYATFIFIGATPSIETDANYAYSLGGDVLTVVGGYAHSFSVDGEIVSLTTTTATPYPVGSVYKYSTNDKGISSMGAPLSGDSIMSGVVAGTDGESYILVDGNVIYFASNITVDVLTSADEKGNITPYTGVISKDDTVVYVLNSEKKIAKAYVVGTGSVSNTGSDTLVEEIGSSNLPDTVHINEGAAIVYNGNDITVTKAPTLSTGFTWFNGSVEAEQSGHFVALTFKAPAGATSEYDVKIDNYTTNPDGADKTLSDQSGDFTLILRLEGKTFVDVTFQWTENYSTTYTIDCSGLGL